jgi:hypothetical protein
VKQANSHSQIKRKEKGQSLVELALFFPIILMMLSGLVEFGFLLNQYLNLMDGPREGARFVVSEPAFIGTSENDNIVFYNLVTAKAINTIFPYVLDPALDDIVISVVSFKDDAMYHRYPDDAGVTSTPGQYSLYHNKTSKYTDFQIGNLLSSQSGVPKGGAVIVEMYYSYHQALALPWLLPFVPDPIQLYMSSVMPLPGATPPEITPIP